MSVSHIDCRQEPTHGGMTPYSIIPRGTMPEARKPRKLDKNRRMLFSQPTVIVVIIALATTAFVVACCLYSPNIPFIMHDSKAKWINHPMVITSVCIQQLYDPVPEFHYVKQFSVQQLPDSVHLCLKCPAQLRVHVNGIPVFDSSQEGKRNWKKESRVEITDALVVGTNTIRADVTNPKGPPLLYACLDGLDHRVATDTTWKTWVWDRPTIAAEIADDTKPYPDSMTCTPSLYLLREKWPLLALIFAFCAVAYASMSSLIPRKIVPYVPFITLLCISVTWIALFVVKFTAITVGTGFDAPAHLEYIAYIFDNNRIPLATEGWSFYHPPLFYILSALLSKLVCLNVWADPQGGHLKLIPFASGLGNIWLAYALARRLFGDEHIKVLMIVLAAAIIPMNIYIAAYVSNESLHAVLISACLLLAVRLLCDRESTPRRLAALGLLCGLALLTKYTAILVVPVICAFVFWKLTAIENKCGIRLLLPAGLTLSLILGISGWFYARNVILYGKLLYGNWDFTGPNSWWQLPGFHTAKYYLMFGQSLQYPYFSGFHSFWDAMHSTFWGDGNLAGRLSFVYRHHAWNYDFMSLSYLVALPAIPIMIIGTLCAIRSSFTDPDRSRRSSLVLILMTAFVVGTSVLLATLKLPYYGQAKAFYALCLMLPISVAMGLGFARIHSGLRGSKWLPVRALFYGWLGTLTFVIYMSYLG